MSSILQAPLSHVPCAEKAIVFFGALFFSLISPPQGQFHLKSYVYSLHERKLSILLSRCPLDFLYFLSSPGTSFLLFFDTFSCIIGLPNPAVPFFCGTVSRLALISIAKSKLFFEVYYAAYRNRHWLHHGEGGGAG